MLDIEKLTDYELSSLVAYLKDEVLKRKALHSNKVIAAEKTDDEQAGGSANEEMWTEDEVEEVEFTRT